MVFELFWPCRFSGFSTRQDGPRGLQNRHNTAPEASKSTPRRPKTVPKQQKRRPRPPKRAPRRPEERPNRGTMNQKSEPAASGVPQEAPRGPQETPKTPKRLPRGPRRPPRDPKETPKRARGLSWTVRSNKNHTHQFYVSLGSAQKRNAEKSLLRWGSAEWRKPLE